ncbi:hypothetical protein ALC56_04860, partial [Trachymyrmex septentrionalis]
SQHPITEPGIRTRCWIVADGTRRRAHVAPGVHHQVSSRRRRRRRRRRRCRPLYLRPSYIPAPCRSPARAQDSLGRSIRPCCRRACRRPQLGPPSAHPRPGPGPLARRPCYITRILLSAAVTSSVGHISIPTSCKERHAIDQQSFDFTRIRNKTIGLTENEAESISKGCLAPDQTPGVDCLGGAVDVTTTDPGRRHREYPDEEPD